MRASDAPVDEVERVATVLPVGKVAELLGVPAVTLRTWDARYGVGPSARTSGLHRRYTPWDVDRLRRMQRLIATGIAAGDAAQLSLQVSTPATADDQDRRIVELAESVAVAELAGVLDDHLMTHGAAATWTELVSPAFRILDERFGQVGDCTDIELLLADAVQAAVERYLDRRVLRPGPGRPVLLVQCPEERHTLPLTMLRAVLLEQGRPVILLGPGSTDQAVTQSVARSKPRVVALWALVRRPGQLRLRNRIEAAGCPVLLAGPGWPASAEPLDDLTSAVDRLTKSHRSVRRSG
ncbi:MerR family transcriptional regulator [Kribbella sp. NPDC049174]|uniref:MerR family transcriptional regulator n=1 Tax=Kribbella sp. NPDC049174 TaxID=3364112 RepID=UPI00371A2353